MTYEELLLEGLEAARNAMGEAQGHMPRGRTIGIARARRLRGLQLAGGRRC
jgi:hypothetical protein